MSTLTPVRPRVKTSLKNGPKKLYTIHLHPNRLYAMKLSIPDTFMCITSCTKRDHAVQLAQMLEEYKRRTGDWPPLVPENQYVLPMGSQELEELTVVQWDKTQLEEFCVYNIFNLITLHSMDLMHDTYKFEGKMKQFQVPFDFYRDKFENLFTVYTDENNTHDDE